MTLQEEINRISWFNLPNTLKGIFKRLVSNFLNDSPFDGNKYSRQDGEWVKITSDEYSTSEIDTGGTWINGKPIYRKVYTGTTVFPTITFASQDMETVVDLNGRIIRNGINTYPLSYFDGAIGVFNRVNDSTKTFVFTAYNFQADAPLTFDSFYITIEYTKTTDN